jgi:hypothetical protein
MGALKSYKCSKGHILKGKNLYSRANGSRECRKCSLERSRRQRKERRSGQAV